jgi:hypothetical protein
VIHYTQAETHHGRTRASFRCHGRVLPEAEPFRYASSPPSGSRTLTFLASLTLFLFTAGLVLASIAWARRGGAVVALGTVFLLGVVRQASLLFTGASGTLGLNLATVESLALLGLALGALATLRSVHRTTKERDHAEDLHWDSMEAIRVMSEPGAKLEDKLETVLRLGLGRFRMDVGGAWATTGADDPEPGRWLELRATGPELAEVLRERLGADLDRAARNAKPLYEVGEDEGSPYVFFGASVRVGDRVQGAIGFAGTRPRKVRFSATENDLLTLMAQWLATELERRDRAAAAPVLQPATDVTESASERKPPAGSLNAEIERAQVRLRRLVGTDATLDVRLGENVPLPHARRIAPAVLLESLVSAAARVAPRGRIEIATGTTANGHGEGTGSDATLCVTAHASDVDAGAFDALFASPEDASSAPEALPAGAPGGLPLDRVERLLRRDGGDLSVAVEPGARLSLTAYLPGGPALARPPSDARPSPAETAARAQSSR